MDTASRKYQACVRHALEIGLGDLSETQLNTLYSLFLSLSIDEETIACAQLAEKGCANPNVSDIEDEFVCSLVIEIMDLKTLPSPAQLGKINRVLNSIWIGPFLRVLLDVTILYLKEDTEIEKIKDLVVNQSTFDIRLMLSLIKSISIQIPESYFSQIVKEVFFEEDDNVTTDLIKWTFAFIRSKSAADLILFSHEDKQDNDK